MTPKDLGVLFVPFIAAFAIPNAPTQHQLSATEHLSKAVPLDNSPYGYMVNLFTDWASIIDCDDILNAPFDNLQAIHKLEAG
ncbi:arginase family protein [Penicillium angulare]|uniref:Arginase family protein n=1 Tax=Penicillium angulare TaxID=116970 RepID=A0A9W9FYD7_9EURO|nr:arginase family protein [Penicillium angulare]